MPRTVLSLKDKSYVGTSGHREKHVSRIQVLPFLGAAGTPGLFSKEIRRVGLPNRLQGALVRFHGLQEGKRP